MPVGKRIKLLTQTSYKKNLKKISEQLMKKKLSLYLILDVFLK